MKKLLYLISVIITAALLSTACRRNVDPTLHRAEALMDSHPDSALALLRTDSIRLAHDPLFALLYTQAQIKTYQNVTDDSLISIAVEYYSGKSDKYYNMLANYYLGCIKYNAGEYAEAIQALHRATEFANTINDSFWLGLINRSLADSYRDTYNFESELEYTKRELYHFMKSGRQPHLDYALNDLSRAYANTEQFDSAIIIASQVKDSARQKGDNILYNEALRNQAISYFGKVDYANAVKTYEKICESDFATALDSAYLGISYADVGRYDDAIGIINNINNHRDKTTLYLKIRVYENAGKTDSAYTCLKQFDNILDNEIRKELEADVSYAIVNQLKTGRDLAISKEQFHKKINIFMLILLLLLALAGYFSFKYYISRQHLKIAQNLEIAEQFKTLLENKEAEFNNAKKSILELMRLKYTWLDELCSQLYEDSNNNKRIKTANAIRTVLDQYFNTPENHKKLESIIDEHYSGLFTDFRSDFPDLKESDYQLYLLSFLGFSSSSIAAILKTDNVSVVYNKRRHLKDKIKAAGDTKSQKYLPFL